MNPEEDISDAVASVMKDLPKPVQDFLISDERSVVARELSSKYSLHADQASEFERAYIFMLLGIATPEEFVAALSQTGLTQDVINGLAADVNTRVFMRLRDKERAATTEQPAASSRPEPLPPPALDYQPAVKTLPGSPVPAPMPATAPAPVVSSPSPEVRMPEVSVSQPIQHVIHSAPTQPQGWHPAAAVHIYVPTQGALHTQPVQAENRPAEALVQPQEVYIAPPAPEQIPVPAPVASVTPVKKDYAADPYREPVQ